MPDLSDLRGCTAGDASATRAGASARSLPQVAPDRRDLGKCLRGPTRRRAGLVKEVLPGAVWFVPVTPKSWAERGPGASCEGRFRGQ